MPLMLQPLVLRRSQPDSELGLLLHMDMRWAKTREGSGDTKTRTKTNKHADKHAKKK